jgi:hypothetical protein
VLVIRSCRAWTLSRLRRGHRISQQTAAVDEVFDWPRLSVSPAVEKAIGKARGAPPLRGWFSILMALGWREWFGRRSHWKHRTAFFWLRSLLGGPRCQNGGLEPPDSFY